MVAHKIFSKMVDYIKQLLKIIFNLPRIINDIFNKISNIVKKIKHNFNNFVETNMKLGKYHLENQNYNDAIFRFKLVDKFFKQNNRQIYYLLGITYFMKRNYKKSIDYLKKAPDEDVIKLLDFIQKIDDTAIIPDKIHNLHRSVTTNSFINKFIDEKNDLPKELVVKLLAYIEKLPDKYSILELGSNIGLMGLEIQKRMPETFVLSGVEISDKMIKMQEEYYPDANYKNIINLSIENFLATNTTKYNIITSLGGISQNADLKNIFAKIYNILVKNGYFALAIRTSKISSLTEKYLEFAYNAKDLGDILEEIGFNILAFNELTIAKNNNYSIFVCKKL